MKTLCLKPKGFKYAKPVKVNVREESKNTYFGKPIGKSKSSIFFEGNKELAFLKSKWSKVKKCQ